MSNLAFSMLGNEPAAIASGTSLSGPVSFGGLRLFAISMPSVWTAASLTFQASFDGGVTWQNMYDVTGNEITVAASASRCVTIDPVIFAAIPMVKVRSGTSSAPVVQAQDSTITLIVRAV